MLLFYYSTSDSMLTIYISIVFEEEALKVSYVEVLFYCIMVEYEEA